ncbi:macrophage mannose receptor 1-like [Arapaima gigas]
MLLAVGLLLLHVMHSVCQTDRSFLIYNNKMDKCMRVTAKGVVRTEICNPMLTSQKFRWVSKNQILSMFHKKCLGVSESVNRVQVMLFDCNDTSELQHWECKSEKVVDLKGQGLHLHSQGKTDASLMVCNDTQCSSNWRMYRTADDICSQPYEETYTILGNAQGAPCRFPFLFKKQWYADCTKSGASTGRLWCATVPDYNKEEKWGYCPSTSTEDWNKDPVTGTLYLVNPSALLTWHQARISCQQQNGDLLSVVEPHEHTYLAGLTKALGTHLWIGLNSLDSESGWQWIDGKPFRYLKWAPGNPSSVPGHNCATLNTNSASMWESGSCSRKLGYICQRPDATKVPTTDPEQDKATVCPSPWVPFMGHCFDLRRPKKRWMEARSICRKEGGDLASIRNIEEQSFIISQLGYLATDKLWIGMNDQRIPKLFEWSDNSAVTFASWELGEPSHHSTLKEDCVLMRGEGGKWADDECEKEHGFICKKKATFSPDSGSAVAPGCKTGWTRHGSYCYHIAPETKTFEEAKQACQSTDAHLVDVSDRYENAFLTSMVGLRPEKYFWMGLSNMEQRDTFTWINTKTVKFTHFSAGMPGQKQGCVAMMTGTSAGLWDVLSCNSQERYICKHVADGVDPTTAPPTTTMHHCPEGWTPMAHRDFCYKYYSKWKEGTKTWFEARDFCKTIGGNLLSIHSKYDLLHKQDFAEAWIGLNALDPNGGFVWSDGSSSSYENWQTGEPNNFHGVERCVEVLYENKWNDRHCESYNGWICQIRKVDLLDWFHLDSLAEHNVTEDGWTVYNGSEYYFNHESLAMEDARDYCQKRGGDLVVINDERERVFLWKQFYEWRSFYIGLTVDLDKTFQWMDGSPVVFVAWDENEPDFANNDENCVIMTSSMGFWQDINCGEPEYSICKRSADSPVNVTQAPTVAPKGGCAPDWKAFRGKCYKFVGEIASDQKSWNEARSYCISQGGNLVSIVSQEEQTFLTAQMINMSVAMWTGLNSVNKWWRFLWTDGRAFKFQNWARGEPNRLFLVLYQKFSLTKQQCTIMIRSPDVNAGFWKTATCSKSYGFICKRNYGKYSHTNPPTTEMSTKYQKFGSSSFWVVEEKLSWDQANQRCMQDSAQLASIPDPMTQAFIYLQTLKHGPLWIGLNSNKTDGYFRWTDKWKFQYTNWAADEPKSDPPCVAVSMNGQWKTEPCNNTYHFMCKISSGPFPTDESPHPGNCPESTLEQTWLPFRDHCYTFKNFERDSWGDASVECIQNGGSLVSILNPAENEFIKTHIEMTNNGKFWIGLYKNHRDQWVWYDGSAVDYTNWDREQPNDLHHCAFIDASNSKWTSYSCGRRKPYICKTMKGFSEKCLCLSGSYVLPTTHGSYGAVVAVVLLLIVVAGLGAFVFYRNRFSARPPDYHNFENYLYFGHTPDRDVLVENMENNLQIMDNTEKNSQLKTI